MASVLDVAAYILAEAGPMTTMKLQKLCYYCQGYSLAWDGVPLFAEPIRAWASGPVVHELSRHHHGHFHLQPGSVDGDPAALDPDQRETIDAVVAAYGHLTGHQLSVKTHREPPWLNARHRAGAPAGIRSDEEICLDELQEYFDHLAAEHASDDSADDPADRPADRPADQ
ncbi:MAG: DUF4065 domain-containing protein [Bifidobacteriaceae bacterium]|nr:DUF4065 domain-containing protein [Bifidobacteriaceae bacterium]